MLQKTHVETSIDVCHLMQSGVMFVETRVGAKKIVLLIFSGSDPIVRIFVLSDIRKYALYEGADGI